MSSVTVIPMEITFLSEDLTEDDLLDRAELLLDFDDVLRFDEVRQQARAEGADVVAREALVGDSKTQRRMIGFGYIANGRHVWKGTLTALARELAS